MCLAQAQVKFEATVSKSKMGRNDRFLLEIRLQRSGKEASLDVGQIFPPSFQDFYLVGGPSTGRQFSMTNGYKVISKTYSYALKPKENGTFRIESATVTVGGKKYNTAPIEIQVEDAFADQDPAKKDVAQDVFIMTRVSNRNPYIGEQIVLTYDLYFSKNIEGLNEEETPSFSGFWNHEIENSQRRKAIQVQHKGRTFSKIGLKKFILIPQKTGKLYVKPLVLSCKVAVPTERVDFWMQRVYEYYDLTLKSRAYNLRVKPLPDRGKPKNFSGAVGSFTFSSTLNKSRVEVHKPVEIKLRVEGKGNLGLFDTPEPSLPTQVERYTPKSNSDVKMTTKGIRGSITSEYIYVPRNTGSYVVEGLHFSYFDPKAHKYKTLRKTDVKIDVFGDAGNTGSASSPSGAEYFEQESDSESEKKKIDYITQDIRYIKTESDDLLPTGEYGRNIFKKGWVYILIFSPLLVLLLFRYALSKVTFQFGSTPKIASNRALQALKAAGKKYQSHSDKTAYYESLQKLIYAYLSMRFGIQKYEFTERRIDQKLTEHDVSEEYISEIREVLSLIDIARFTPSSMPDISALHNRVSDWIRATSRNI